MPEPTTPTITFPNRGPFHQALRKGVRGHLDSRKQRERDLWQMYLKTALALAVAVTGYFGLLMFADSLLEAAFFGFLLAQGHVLIGFNVMHDGGHGAYSKRPWVNRVMGRMLDLIGVSQRIWDHKHNKLHHTYTNIDELDDDIHAGALLRLSPVQERLWWHRYQAWYALPLYSLLSLDWVLRSDFWNFLTRRIGDYRMGKAGLAETVEFFSWKVFYFGYALVVPLLLFEWWLVAIGFVAVHLVIGLTISLVFQLAHTVELTEFPIPDDLTGHVEDEWAVHQLRTTANFACGNPWVSWYVGGLNFQVEHHLFTKICHIRYPDISPVVRDVCRRFGVPYNEFPSVRAALWSHLRFLHQLGARP